jgi:hypothetical protein
MYLNELTCTHCNGAGLEVEAAGEALCRYCGTRNTVAGVICPRCEQVNPPDAEACAACFQGLAARCPDCSALNWTGAERCAQCGRTLDAVARLTTRWGTDPASRLNAQARDAAAIKAQEAADARRRLDALNAIEARRLQLVAEARARRDAQQRTLLVVVGLAVLGIVGVAALAAAVLAR